METYGYIKMILLEFMEVKGGADQDDNCAIIPVEDGKAVIYRSPNQYGEYGIHKIKAVGFELVHDNKLVGEVPIEKYIKQGIFRPRIFFFRK